MIISFAGHRKIYEQKKISTIVEETIKQLISSTDNIVFYCGGYGDFDTICENVCRNLKNTLNTNIEITYITPYLDVKSQETMNNFISDGLYDSIIYPPIENTPLRYAIIKRNEWMVRQSDIIIAYVKYTYGGAYKTLRYANNKKKHIINLGEYY